MLKTWLIGVAIGVGISIILYFAISYWSRWK